jgi:multicomponent K+:H+ antiporter subunit F
MIATALDIALALFTLALLPAAWRLLRGPSLPDRILALDTMYVLAMALVVILGIRYRTQVYFEAALVIAMLGFFSTVLAARGLSRGDVIEHD